MVNSQTPRGEGQLRERHTEICPRISDPGSECLVCEVFQHLKRSQDTLEDRQWAAVTKTVRSACRIGKKEHK